MQYFLECVCVSVFLSLCLCLSVLVSVSTFRGQHHEAMGLHYAMFVPTLQSQTDDEQRKKWLPLVLSHQAIGTYAQTELGHG